MQSHVTLGSVFLGALASSITSTRIGNRARAPDRDFASVVAGWEEMTNEQRAAAALDWGRSEAERQAASVEDTKAVVMFAFPDGGMVELEVEPGETLEESLEKLLRDKAADLDERMPGVTREGWKASDFLGYFAKEYPNLPAAHINGFGDAGWGLGSTHEIFSPLQEFELKKTTQSLFQKQLPDAGPEYRKMHLGPPKWRIPKSVRFYFSDIASDAKYVELNVPPREQIYTSVRRAEEEMEQRVLNAGAEIPSCHKTANFDKRYTKIRIWDTGKLGMDDKPLERKQDWMKETLTYFSDEAEGRMITLLGGWNSQAITTVEEASGPATERVPRPGNKPLRVTFYFKEYSRSTQVMVPPDEPIERSIRRAEGQLRKYPKKSVEERYMEVPGVNVRTMRDGTEDAEKGIAKTLQKGDLTLDILNGAEMFFLPAPLRHPSSSNH